MNFNRVHPVGRRCGRRGPVGNPHPARAGGKAPFVVFDDADLDAAIQGAAPAH